MKEKIEIDCSPFEMDHMISINEGDLIGVLPNGHGVKITAVGRCYAIGNEPGRRKVEMINIDESSRHYCSGTGEILPFVGSTDSIPCPMCCPEFLRVNRK